MTRLIRTAGLLTLLLVPMMAASQDYFGQYQLIDIIERRDADLDALPTVYYNYHIVTEETRLGAKLTLNSRYGLDNKPLLQLLNRSLLEDLNRGDTLVIPTHLDLDFRAYSPFPRFYPGARDIDKVVILDKSIQAFAAYEWGRLLRWGILNTGAESSRTPSGRFNVNWKQDYRISTLSPPDDPWEMYWVMNIHEGRGIHLHQYAMPTAGPASHGCVRLLDPDAIWLYNWTDTWEKTGGSEISSVGARITKQGSMVLVIGEDISGPPSVYTFRHDYPVLNKVQLPPDPYDVPAGTEQQRQFDRFRAQQARAGR
jgi:hypothetical protein